MALCRKRSIRARTESGWAVAGRASPGRKRESDMTHEPLLAMACQKGSQREKACFGAPCGRPAAAQAAQAGGTEHHESQGAEPRAVFRSAAWQVVPVTGETRCNRPTGAV
jgi:hypothetical protein